MPHEAATAYGSNVATFVPVSGDSKMSFSVKPLPLVICSGDNDSDGRLYRINNGIRMYEDDMSEFIAILEQGDFILEVVYKKNSFVAKVTTKNVSNSGGPQVKPLNERRLDDFNDDGWDEFDYLFAWIIYMELCDDLDSAEDDDWQEDMEPYGDEEGDLEVDLAEDDNGWPEMEESDSDATLSNPEEVDMEEAPLISDPFEDDGDHLLPDDQQGIQAGYSMTGDLLQAIETNSQQDVVDNDFQDEDNGPSDDVSSDGDTDY